MRGYAVAGAVTFEQEYRILRADRECRWVHDFTKVICNVQGEVTHYDGYILDITERKHAEEQRQEETEIVAALARVAREMIVAFDTPTLLDRLCRIMTEVLGCDCSHTSLWNPQENVYCNVAGYGDTPEQWEMIHAMKIPRVAVANLAARLVDVGGILESECTDPERFFPDALMQKLGITASLYVGIRQGAQIVGTLNASYRGRRGFSAKQKRLAQGIAQIASLALANARLLEELERSNRVKEDFVSTMSHDLRTPLNILLGYSEILREGTLGALSQQQTEILERIEKSARELLELINSTLDVSRLHSQRGPLFLQQV
jgi:GAF domain-containing protein